MLPTLNRHIRPRKVVHPRAIFEVNRALSTKIDFNDAATSFKTKSLPELLRAYFVFQTCRVKFLVKNSESLIKKSYAILGEGPTDYVLRKTFFGHFCAGQDTPDMGPTIRRLENSGIGSILDYAAEADIEEEAPGSQGAEKAKKAAMETSPKSARVYDYCDEELCDERTKVFVSCIKSAHELQKGSTRASLDGFAAIKCTALGNPKLLERISTTIVEIRNLFLKFDVNNSGRISKEDFKKQYQLYFTSGEDVEEVFRKMDLDADDTVDYVEWSNALPIEELHKLTSFCKTKGPLANATLTEEERGLLLVMRNRINGLADLADQLNVKLMIDAEHTYFQPAIDNIAWFAARTWSWSVTARASWVSPHPSTPTRTPRTPTTTWA